MSNKIFITPRLIGARFEDHALPISLLEDFTALEALLIEVAKGIYLDENASSKQIPIGFSDGIYLKLLDVEEGSSVAKFTIASISNHSAVRPLDIQDNFPYFEKAKHKIVSIIRSVNEGGTPYVQDASILSYFHKIGANLLDDESIDFGYNYETKTNSNAILSKVSRMKLLSSSTPMEEYVAPFSLYALIPEIDQKNNTFHIESDFGNIQCPLSEHIKDTVFFAFNNYKNNTHIHLQGKAIYLGTDGIQEVATIESAEIVNPLDVSFRIASLLKLGNNWLEGQGTAINKDDLINFGNLLNAYFDSDLPLPAIFPKLDGNIQLEWKNNHKNILLDVALDTLNSDFLYYNSTVASDEKHVHLHLNYPLGWDQLNELIKNYI